MSKEQNYEDLLDTVNEKLIKLYPSAELHDNLGAMDENAIAESVQDIIDIVESAVEKAIRHELSDIEDNILELVDNQNDMPRSDLQGAVTAQVQRAYNYGKK